MEIKILLLILFCGWLIRIIDYFIQEPKFNKSFFICSLLALFCYALPPLGLYLLLIDLFCIIRFLCLKSYQHWRHISNWIYLACSDCDGMCEHCNHELKKRCYERKGLEISCDNEKTN